MNNLYLFAFDKYAGFDRVFVTENIEGIQVGDMIKINGSYFLCLGQSVSFQELYKYEWEVDNYQIVEQKFFDQTTLEFIDFVVKHCYTTYKKVMKLFIDFNISRVMSRKLKTSVKPEYRSVCIDYSNYKANFQDTKTKGQQLIVVPNLRTARQLFDIDEMAKGKRFLHSKSTSKTKQTIHWRIKTGRVGTLICTYSQIFWNWKQLDKIVIVDKHKWYYKNQQDPRYYVPDMLGWLSDRFDCQYNEYGYSLDSK